MSGTGVVYGAKSGMWCVVPSPWGSTAVPWYTVCGTESVVCYYYRVRRVLLLRLRHVVEHGVLRHGMLWNTVCAGGGEGGARGLHRPPQHPPGCCP
eukprot:986755-Rhodomonas_salina.1